MFNIIAVDTGKGGGFVYNLQERLYAFPFTKEETLRQKFTGVAFDYAVLEKASASSQQGVSSAFTTGENFGYWQGNLSWLRPPENPVDIVMAQTWVRWLKNNMQADEPQYPERPAHMGRKEWYTLIKKYNKELAQLRFPQIKVTNAIADALLIWQYANEKYNG